MASSKRNWKIDFLRFVFSLGILFYHYSSNLPQIYGFALGCHANICVEFFLIVTGYLLASKILTSNDEIDILQFVKKKLFSFYWIWIIAVVLTVARSLISGMKTGYEGYISDLLLLYGFGFTNGYMQFGWYLSSMMIIIILLIPVLIKVKKRDNIRSDFIYMTFFELFIIGELYIHSQKLSGITETIGIFLKCNIRACSGILLGVILFVYRQYISEPDSTNSVFKKTREIVLQTAAYLYLFIFMNRPYPNEGLGEFLALGCMGIIVYYCFKSSDKKNNSRSKLSDFLTTFCNCLGKLSLPIYLFHTVIKDTLNRFLLEMDPIRRLVLISATTIVLSSVVLLIRYLYDYLLSKKKQSPPPKSGKEMCISYCAAAGLAVAMCPVSFGVIDAVYKPTHIIINNSVEYKDKSSTVSCYTSTVVSEDFQVENTSKLAEIKFYTITWNKSFADDQQMKVVIRNKDTNEEVYAETRKISEFQDGKAFSLIPDENVVLTGSSWYTIEFVPTTREEQEYMALMMTNVTNNAGKAYLNGEETDEHISMKIITQEL